MIFKNLQQQPPDKILALMTAFKEDPRDQKLDLGVGVYKDPTGITPIMRSIKLAEKKWWEIESSKSYVGLVGAPAFSDAIISLVLGNCIPRITGITSTGPSGVLCTAFLADIASNQLIHFVKYHIFSLLTSSNCIEICVKKRLDKSLDVYIIRFVHLV